MLDVLIKGGTVVDGSGAPGRPADVAIAGDRVVAVEPLPAAGAARVIDATGLAVAPGFIDMHSHADFVLPGLPTADSKVHQGFTLEVVGNCGASPAPLSPLRRQDVIDTSALVVPPLEWDWSSFASFLPDWAHVGGKAALLARLEDPAAHGRIREALDGPGLARDAGWEGIVIAGCPARPAYEGRSLADIATERGAPPAETVIDVLREARADADMILFMMSEENVALGLRHPQVMLGSDGEGRAAEGPYAVGKPHPRNYGSCPRLLGHYVRERRILPLEEAVRKMTSLPAAKLGLRDRGLLRPGAFADVVVFDPETVADTATFADPHRYPSGIPWVLVNGQPVIAEGRHTGARPVPVVTR